MKSDDFNCLFEKAGHILDAMHFIASKYSCFHYDPEFTFFPFQKKLELCAYLNIIYSASNGTQALEVTTRKNHSQLKAVITEHDEPFISSEVQEQIDCREENTELSDRVANILAENSAVSGRDYIIDFAGIDLLKFDRKPHSFRGWTGGYIAYPELYGVNKLLSQEMDAGMEWQAGDHFANISRRICSLKMLYDLLLAGLEDFNLQAMPPMFKKKAGLAEFRQMIDSDFCNGFLEYRQELDSLFSQGFSPMLDSSGLFQLEAKNTVCLDHYKYPVVRFQIEKNSESKDKYSSLLLVCHKFPSAKTFEKAKKEIGRYCKSEGQDYLVREYEYNGVLFKIVERSDDSFFIIELEKTLEDRNALFNEMKRINPVMAEFYKIIKKIK